jgi:hypothetical protein
MPSSMRGPSGPSVRPSAALTRLHAADGTEFTVRGSYDETVRLLARADALEIKNPDGKRHRLAVEHVVWIEEAEATGESDGHVTVTPVRVRRWRFW